MNRRGLLNIAVMAVSVLGLALLPGNATGQQRSLKDALVGTWTLVSIDALRQDGGRSQMFGASPKGVAMFDGRNYITSVMRSDRPPFAVNDRMQGTAEENKATSQGTITYFGTYSVSEADRVMLIRIDGSSFPNWNGADQKRLFTLTADELKLIVPPPPTGGAAIEVVWKRAN